MNSRNNSPGIMLLVLAGVMVIGAVIISLLIGPASPARGTLTGMGTQADVFYYSLTGGLVAGAIVLIGIFYNYG